MESSPSRSPPSSPRASPILRRSPRTPRPVQRSREVSPSLAEVMEGAIGLRRGRGRPRRDDPPLRPPRVVGVGHGRRDVDSLITPGHDLEERDSPIFIGPPLSPVSQLLMFGDEEMVLGRIRRALREVSQAGEAARAAIFALCRAMDIIEAMTEGL